MQHILLLQRTTHSWGEANCLSRAPCFVGQFLWLLIVNLLQNSFTKYMQLHSRRVHSLIDLCKLISVIEFASEDNFHFVFFLRTQFHLGNCRCNSSQAQATALAIRLALCRLTKPSPWTRTLLWPCSASPREVSVSAISHYSLDVYLTFVCISPCLVCQASRCQSSTGSAMTSLSEVKSFTALPRTTEHCKANFI